MKKLFAFLVCFVVVLVGCNAEKQFPEEHQAYLSTYGWEIAEQKSSETKKINLYPEAIDMIKRAGLDLEPYKGKEATITTYRLKEKQATGDEMYAVLYEINDKLIGGYGSLENWAPGLFALDDKERLIDDDVLKP
ncbi:DUF4830 domain-containing protein [Bacillus tianshenii]|nr:DUF4830 domain-containing protein [Bacillus tianshenii]